MATPITGNAICRHILLPLRQGTASLPIGCDLARSAASCLAIGFKLNNRESTAVRVALIQRNRVCHVNFLADLARIYIALGKQISTATARRSRERAPHGDVDSAFSRRLFHFHCRIFRSGMVVAFLHTAFVPSESDFGDQDKADHRSALSLPFIFAPPWLNADKRSWFWLRIPTMRHLGVAARSGC